MQNLVRGHVFEREGLPGKRLVCVRPIGMFRAGGVEAYTVDHRPIRLRSACTLGVEETMTCDEFPGTASGLETRRKGRGDLFIIGGPAGSALPGPHGSEQGLAHIGWNLIPRGLIPRGPKARPSCSMQMKYV